MNRVFQRWITLLGTKGELRASTYISTHVHETAAVPEATEQPFLEPMKM